MNERRLIEHFIAEEGIRLKSYKDTKGYWTIGVGHMMGKHPKFANMVISRDEAEALLLEDIAEAFETCRDIFPAYDTHPENVKLGLLDMAFNLGYHKLKKFRKTVALVKERRYKDAAEEALDSDWARNDVPNRARRTAQLIASGELL